MCQSPQLQFLSLEVSMAESQLLETRYRSYSSQLCFYLAKWLFFITWLPERKGNRSWHLPRGFYPFYSFISHFFEFFLQMTAMWPKHQQEKLTQRDSKWPSSDCFGYGELPKLPLERAQAAFLRMGLNEISCIVLQPSTFLAGCKHWHKLW